MAQFTLAAETDPQIEQLRTAMLDAAEDYPLIIDIQQLIIDNPTEDLDYRPILDAFVARYGYTGLADHWIEIPRRMARKILQHVLSESLAYPDPIMDEEEASQFTERFLDLFASGSRYFTNGTCSGETTIYTSTGEEVLGWRPISTATFDNGIIAVNPRRIGMVWAEDEN